MLRPFLLAFALSVSLGKPLLLRGPAFPQPPVPCSAEYIPQFPIPLQALIAFTLSMVLLSRQK